MGGTVWSLQGGHCEGCAEGGVRKEKFKGKWFVTGITRDNVVCEVDPLTFSVVLVVEGKMSFILMNLPFQFGIVKVQ